MNNSDKPVMGIVNGGMHYHIDSIQREPLKDFFDVEIYLRDLPLHDLSKLDILILPCRTNPHYLALHDTQFLQFMAQGGTLVAMGDTRPDMWLKNVHYRPVETNFWWWLTEGADLGVEMSTKDHSINKYISKKEATYHLHGVFEPLAENQQMLIETKEGGCLLFEDTLSYGKGRLVATTLDPFFHHGGFFMPATTQFLLGFLPWLNDSCTAEKGAWK